MVKRCLCGHDIGPTDEVTFQLNGKCKACHDRDTAFFIEQIRQFLNQTNITLEEKIAATQRLAEIEEIEKRIKEDSQSRRAVIRVRNEYEL